MNKRKITIVSLCAACLVLLITATFFIIAVSKRSSFDRFFEIVSESSPTSYVCDLSYTLGSTTLCGKYELLVADIDGEECAKLTYEYEKLADIGEADAFKSTLRGTLYAKGDGQVGQMKDSAVVWETGTLPAEIIPFKFSRDEFDKFEISEKNGKIITFTGKLVKDTLGKSIKDAFVYIECEKESERITKLSLKYTDASEASVSAVYVYSYGKQVFEIE